MTSPQFTARRATDMAENITRDDELPDGYIVCPACGGEGELADGYGCEECYCTGRIEIER